MRGCRQRGAYSYRCEYVLYTKTQFQEMRNKPKVLLECCQEMEWMCVSSDFVPGTASLQLSTPSTLTTPDATARRYRGALRNCRKLFVAMVAMVVS